MAKDIVLNKKILSGVHIVKFKKPDGSDGWVSYYDDNVPEMLRDANAALGTGNHKQTLAEAVEALIEGYGQGSGTPESLADIIGEITGSTDREKIDALIAMANTVTTEDDDTLRKAIDSLIEGYGQGDNPPVIQPLNITENGTYTAPSGVDGYSPITVSIQDTVPPISNDVNFIDYDGTLLYSYTAEEFAELTALPANPTHPGLTAQGWNWSLVDAKSFVDKYGMITIGQNYITSDGKTRLYIHLEYEYRTPSLGLKINGTAQIDWGDGSEIETLTGTSTTNSVYTEVHEYANAGDYVISIDITNDGNVKACFPYVSSGNNAQSEILRGAQEDKSDMIPYRNSINKIELGDGIQLQSSVFRTLQALESVTIPNDIQNFSSTYLFVNCLSLKGLVIPPSATGLGNGTFSGCTSLRMLSCPSSINFISNSVLGSTRIMKIVVPEATTIGTNLFQNQVWLVDAVLPDPDTAYEITSGMFDGCKSLPGITIPSKATTIGSKAFNNCIAMKYIRFMSDDPPTVSNSDAFAGLSSNCVIYVPKGTLDAYTNETNYPDSNVYTYMEDEA